jgi:hypothetical protein
LSYDARELMRYCDRCDQPMPLIGWPGKRPLRIPPPNPLYVDLYVRGPREKQAAAVPFGDLEFCEQCLPQLAEALAPLISEKSKARALANRGSAPAATPPYKTHRPSGTNDHE